MTNAEQTLKISELISKSFLDDLTQEQEVELNQWLSESEHNRELFQTLHNQDMVKSKLESYRSTSYEKPLGEFLRLKHDTEHHTRIIRRRKVMSYAAAALFPMVITGGLLYFGLTDKSQEQIAYNQLNNTSEITLTLSSGQQLTLDKNDNAKTINELTTAASTTIENNVVQYNTITVPRGQEFFLTLDDGSEIWLNADTELKFPTHFDSDSREVFLSGEAFFEVAEDLQRQFTVVTERACVRVFGTSFNVQAYRDDDQMTTTLTAGSVEIEATGKLMLKPGEHAVISANGTMSKSRVNTNLYTSWRDRRLVLKSMPMEELLQILSRWYDVNFSFERDQLRTIVFTGELEKYKDIDDVLEAVKLTSGAKFRTEKDTIIVF